MYNLNQECQNKMPSPCLRSSPLCPSSSMGEGGECCSYSSRRKTVRKSYMRPQTLGEARRQRRNISRNSFFFTAISSQAGRSGLLVLLFWFVSRPGTVAISDSHMLALGWLWPFFILNFFSFSFFSSSSSMNFLLFFQIQSVDEIAVLLSQSFLDLFKVRSQLLKSKRRGTF